MVFDGINKSQIIDIKNRKYYSDKDIDITIIELKYEDNIENYLELDKLTINNIKNTVFLFVIVAPNVPNFFFCDNDNKKVRQWQKDGIYGQIL